MKIWITGATGFLGRSILESLKESAHEPVALVRRQNHGLSGVSAVEVSLDSEASLVRLMGMMEASPPDALIHCAGGSLGYGGQDLVASNFETTRTLAHALRGRVPKDFRFLLISTVSAGGPLGNMPGTVSQPISIYGKAKLRAEEELLSLKDELDVRMLRLPALYGKKDPRMERLLRWVARRSTIAMPNPEQPISMVSTRDSVTAIQRLLETPRESLKDERYWIHDGIPYTARDMVLLIAEALGKKTKIRRIPRALVHTASALSELTARVTSRPTYFHRDKIRDLLCPGWICDAEPAKRDFGWLPTEKFETSLPEMIRALL